MTTRPKARTCWRRSTEERHRTQHLPWRGAKPPGRKASAATGGMDRTQRRQRRPLSGALARMAPCCIMARPLRVLSRSRCRRGCRKVNLTFSLLTLSLLTSRLPYHVILLLTTTSIGLTSCLSPAPHLAPPPRSPAFFTGGSGLGLSARPRGLRASPVPTSEELQAAGSLHQPWMVALAHADATKAPLIGSGGGRGSSHRRTPSGNGPPGGGRGSCSKVSSIASSMVSLDSTAVD